MNRLQVNIKMIDNKGFVIHRQDTWFNSHAEVTSACHELTRDFRKAVRMVVDYALPVSKEGTNVTVQR